LSPNNNRFTQFLKFEAKSAIYPLTYRESAKIQNKKLSKVRNKRCQKCPRAATPKDASAADATFPDGKRRSLQYRTTPQNRIVQV
jgi:hypothetical protein